MTSSPVTLADIQAARARLAGGVLATPCPESIPLSELCGGRVFCKLEYLQRTGSFKERGARNALLLMSAEARARGVIAASAGNHAQALAYHGQLLGVPVTVVMPRFAPLVKQMNCQRLGARVVLGGESFAAARAEADRLAAAEQLTYVHGYDDPAIIAGQGTLGLEILEQVPAVDALVVPVGGGGLIAGVALAVKSLRPEIDIIGVEAANAPCYSAALAAGAPVAVDCKPTLADGLAVGKVGANALALAREHVRRVVQVEESHLAQAIVRLMELEKSVVEGAGAAGLAALLAGRLPELAGKRVVLVLAGGNIDLKIASRLIELALVADGRLARFTATISDRPGGLARLAAIMAELGVSVQDIAHDRAFAGPNVAAVNVICTVETRDRAHLEQLYAALTTHGIAHFRHAP